MFIYTNIWCMNSYNVIKKTIEEKFSENNRQVLLSISSSDIMQSLEIAQSIIKEFHKNIVTQASLLDIDKKALAFFFNITVEQNLTLLLAIKKGNETIDMKHIYSVYADVLHQRTLTAVIQFLEKIYFPQRVKWLMESDSFSLEMQGLIEESYQKWPLAKNKLKHIYKTKKFYEECIAIYIQKHQKITDDIIHIHRKDVLDKMMLVDPSEGVLVNFFAHEVLHFCNPIVHNDISRKLFVSTIEEKIRESHKDTIRREEMESQKNKWKKYNKDIPNQSTKSDQEVAVTTKNTEIFDQIFWEFEKSSNKKLQITMEKIKQYVRRMYKKNSNIHMSRIQEELWSLFDDEAIKLVRDLCTMLDVSIFELEVVAKESKEILGWDILINPVKDNDGEATKTINSPTLLTIQDSPEKLTTELLITICKELWYRFWDEQEFTKYANKLGMQKEWKVAIAIKKKLIEYFSKPENDTWIVEWSRSTKKYEKLVFNDYSRMVKQKKTILWLTDHKTYDNLVNLHFTTNKTDFDALMLSPRKEWDTDSRCI